MKFLLIQLRRIGDVLMTTPSIRLLRESFPEAHLAFLTESPSDQVLRENPYLDEILLFRKGETLWKTRLGTSVQGYPMTFEVDGVQDVAMTTAREGGKGRQKESGRKGKAAVGLDGNQSRGRG